MSLFRWIYKSVLGFFAFLGLMTLLLAVLIGVAINRADEIGRVAQERQLPDEIVLTIDLVEGLREGPEKPSFLGTALQPGVPLHAAIEALHRAQQDGRVKGLVIRSGRGALGLAQAQELRQAIADFRADGKWTASFAETYGEAGHGTLHYYLASATEEVWLQPSGDLDLTGFSMESPYLREALDKLGVTPQFAQRHEFKGVMNTFTSNRMPAPVKRNTQGLLDSLFEQVAQDIQGDRGEIGDVVGLINNAPYAAEEALEAKLVDRLGYWDELSDTALSGAREFVSLKHYAFATTPKVDDEAPRIALIYGQGEIRLDASYDDPLFGEVVLGSDTIAEAVATAAEDDSIEAIVLRINSPGGSYVASDVIWREVQRARDMGKPVIVSMGEVAASGGYFIAAPAEKIFVNPGTITGSIGVAGGKMVLDGLWDKLGVTWDGVKAGDNADLYSANQPFDSEGWERLNDTLDRIYDDFTGKVAQGREMERAQVHAVAKGQIWSGAQAVENGLADELGGLRDAIQAAREAAGIAKEQPHQTVLLPEPVDPLEALLQDMTGGRVLDPQGNSSLRGLMQVMELAAPLLSSLKEVKRDPRSRLLHAGVAPIDAD